MGRRDEDVQLVFVCYCVFVKLSWLWTVVEMLHEYHGSCFTHEYRKIRISFSLSSQAVDIHPCLTETFLCHFDF